MSESLNKDNWKKLARSPRIGEILIQHGKITVAHLGMALDIQKYEKLPIGEIFIRMGVITEEELLKYLELQVNINKKLNCSLDEIQGSYE